MQSRSTVQAKFNLFQEQLFVCDDCKLNELFWLREAGDALDVRIFNAALST